MLSEKDLPPVSAPASTKLTKEEFLRMWAETSRMVEEGSLVLEGEQPKRLPPPRFRRGQSDGPPHRT